LQDGALARARELTWANAVRQAYSQPEARMSGSFSRFNLAAD